MARRKERLMDVADFIDRHAFECIERREAALRPAPVFVAPAPVDRPPLVLSVPERLLRLTDGQLAERMRFCAQEIQAAPSWSRESLEFTGFYREYLIESERRSALALGEDHVPF
jgi:hypothetical protein